MEGSQKRNSTGVRWADESKDEQPISNTIPGSEMERAIRPSDLRKITTHKRYPSNKLKPIIKHTSMVWAPGLEVSQQESSVANSQNFGDNNPLSPPSREIENRHGLHEDQSKRILSEAFDKYHNDVDSAVQEHTYNEQSSPVQVKFFFNFL